MEIGQDLLSHCSTLCSRTYDTTIVCKVLETLSWNENFARKAQNLGKVGNCFQYKFFWIIFLENLKLLEWYFINMYLHPCKPYNPRKYDTCHLQSKYQNYCLHFFFMSIILIDNLIFESTQQIFDEADFGSTFTCLFGN